MATLRPVSSPQSADTQPGFAERAEAMIPTLNARGAEGDRDRRLPNATITELIDAGILQMLAPRAVGGSQASLVEFFDTAVALARGDASTAWVFGILGSHHWVAAHFPPEGQKEMFGPRGEALFPLTFSGKGGTATRVEGGWRVYGHWGFATGIDQSEWVGALARIEGEEEGATVNVVMRRDEVEVIDNWHVAGLRATGSRDFRAENVFVPDRRSLLQADLMAGRTPGAAQHRDYIGLRTPLHTLFIVPTAATVIGLARRAIDDFIAFTKSRTGYGGIDHGGRASTQSRIAGTLARWDAYHDRLRGQFAEISDLIAAGEKCSVDQRLRIRRDVAQAAAECAAIVQEICWAAGARAQHESSPFQQIQRDMNTARTHVILDQDDANEIYGRFVLGLDLGLIRQ